MTGVQTCALPICDAVAFSQWQSAHTISVRTAGEVPMPAIRIVRCEDVTCVLSFTRHRRCDRRAISTAPTTSDGDTTAIVQVALAQFHVAPRHPQMLAYTLNHTTSILYHRIKIWGGKIGEKKRLPYGIEIIRSSSSPFDRWRSDDNAVLASADCRAGSSRQDRS